MATLLRVLTGPLAAWPVESSLIGAFEFEFESGSLFLNGEESSFVSDDVRLCSLVLSSSLMYCSSDDRRCLVRLESLLWE